MTEVQQLQQSIIQLFREQFVGDPGNYKLSMPLIPRISENYLINRTVVVGQETNTWWVDGYRQGFINPGADIAKNALEICYDPFVRDCVNTYGGKFWQFNRSLYNENIISGKIVENGKLSHAWINLFAMEACSNKNDNWGRPTKNLELRNFILNLQKDITYRLLCLLKPRLVIFLTGCTLDQVISEYALNNTIIERISIDKNNVFDERHLCEIRIAPGNPLSDSKILRLYHPSYFLARINSKSNVNIVSKAKNIIGKAPSTYYTELVFDFLKSNKQLRST